MKKIILVSALVMTSLSSESFAMDDDNIMEIDCVAPLSTQPSIFTSSVMVDDTNLMDIDSLPVMPTQSSLLSYPKINFEDNVDVEDREVILNLLQLMYPTLGGGLVRISVLSKQKERSLEADY